MPVPEAYYAKRALACLELLALRPRSAPKLADALVPPVHVRTARRILRRLEDEGYVVITPGRRRRYRATLRVVALAGVALANSDITRASIPQLARLRDEVGISSCLCVPSSLSAVCVAHLPADSDDGCQPGIRGRLVPCHATASGKALLAARSSWRREILKQKSERHTQRTMTGEYLWKDLERWTATRGFAIEDREFVEDKRAVAAAVRDHTGDAVAALTVVGTVEQLPFENLSSIGGVVMAAATDLSEALGNRAVQSPPRNRTGVRRYGCVTQ